MVFQVLNRLPHPILHVLMSFLKTSETVTLSLVCRACAGVALSCECPAWHGLVISELDDLVRVRSLLALRRMSRLQYLAVEKNVDSFDWIPQHVCASIRCLAIHGVSVYGLDTNVSSSCLFKPSYGSFQLVLRCFNLQALHLVRLDEYSLFLMINALTSPMLLNTLVLRSCQISQVLLEHLQSFPSLHTLVIFEPRFTGAFRDSDLTYALSLVVPQLRTLEFGGLSEWAFVSNSNNGNSLVYIRDSFLPTHIYSNLQELCLDYSTQLTDEFIKHLSCVCTYLTLLSICGCFRISPQALCQYLDLPYLQIFRARNISQVFSPDSLVCLLYRSVGLQQLEIDLNSSFPRRQLREFIFQSSNLQIADLYLDNGIHEVMFRFENSEQSERYNEQRRNQQYVVGLEASEYFSRYPHPTKTMKHYF